MNRKEGDRPKRSKTPTTYVGNNRQMLQEIRDSLSHLRKTSATSAADPMQIKTELSGLQQPPVAGDSRTSQANNKSSLYRQKALAEIRNSLLPFENGLSSSSSTVSTISSTTTSGISSGGSGLSNASGSSSPCQSVEHNGLDKDHSRIPHHHGMYDEDPTSSRGMKVHGVRTSGGDPSVVEAFYKLQAESQQNAISNKVIGLSSIASKLIRKPSFEGGGREIGLNGHRMSPALESSTASTRSDSPSITLGGLQQRSTPFDSVSRNGDPMSHLQVSRQYSPNFGLEPPPPPPPRLQGGPPPTPPRGTTPPPPPQMELRLGQQSYLPTNQHVHNMLKRISPAPQTSRPSPALGYSSPLSQSSTPQRGTSPVSLGRAPMMVQNSLQHQRSHHLQCAMYNGGMSQIEPPPPYPLVSPQVVTKLASPPPPYTSVASNRQSPTLSGSSEYTAAVVSQLQKRASPNMYQATSPLPAVATTAAGATISTAIKPAPLQAWSARQPPPIMLSVKSTQVQKPVLQTAVAPTAPPSTNSPAPPPCYTTAVHQNFHPAEIPLNCVVNSPTVIVAGSVPPSPPINVYNTAVAAYPAVATAVANPTNGDPPSYASAMQARATVGSGLMSGNNSPANYGIQYASPVTGPSPVTVNNLAAAMETHLRTSPSPPSIGSASESSASSVASQYQQFGPVSSSAVLKPGCGVDSLAYGVPSSHHQPLQRKYSPMNVETASPSMPASQNSSPNSMVMVMSQSPASSTTSSPATTPGDTPTQELMNSARNKNANAPPSSAQGNCVNGNGGNPANSWTHHSPIPERRMQSREREMERRETKVRNYSPQAFKFFMEQHVENVLKSHQQRQHRRLQLEAEMAKVGLTDEAQFQMRKMLHQKESNYIRLKRAKMDKAQFVKIKSIGVGAFGEVALVRKMDAKHLYAMKTLRKNDVLKRNQVAHVKAERDILAEADNEWVVKLYYSFQDHDYLYFVMDYIPGGDLMSLLIKFGIFQESLARFYIAELVCAVESVHRMGFIHRDIKPDNILIDRDGHIKLTDFGLCTGFRWTHNSKYYQNGEHSRQDSMEPDENWTNECRCNISNLKPLERRRRREHQRCQAHSLVGTPNYIAPEVLMRTGYTQLCDWWSVGVILYEMLVGQPPFLANTPVETQFKVINWETTLKIPRQANLTAEAKDLILKLCCCHDRRLGKNGSGEVKAHPFFANVDYEGGIRRQTAPYRPTIRHATDTSNFDPVDPDRLRNSDSSDSEDKGLSGYDNGKHPEHAFFEFTFRRFFDDGGHAYPTRQELEDTENPPPVYV